MSSANSNSDMHYEEPFSMKVNGIREKLNNYVKSVDICKLVKEHGAIMAGGSISYLVTDIGNIKDIDIFVPKKNIDAFEEAIVNGGWKRELRSTYAEYTKDNYYIGKDKVLYRGNFFNVENDEKKLDIMCVDNNTEMHKDIILGFDLSCCQFWYDGNEEEKVHGTDKNALNGKANVTPKYVDIETSRTKERISKYTKKGFTIYRDGKEISSPSIEESLQNLSINDPLYVDKKTLLIDGDNRAWIEEKGQKIEMVPKDQYNCVIA